LESEETAVVSASKYKSYTDPELVSMCLKGDGHAWEALIRRYRRLIYSVPVRFGFEDADAADVFQAVCLKLLEHLHQVKDDRRISAWLITTTTRQCLHLRTLKSRETTADEELQEPEDPTINLEELRLLTEQQQAIRESVEELGERCRVLIRLLYFDTSTPSYDRISEQMGIPVASIGPTRARCLDKLRTMLRRRGIR
jgi:RNA polymerase sigma factor (sigma-70 family)